MKLKIAQQSPPILPEDTRLARLRNLQPLPHGKTGEAQRIKLLLVVNRRNVAFSTHTHTKRKLFTANGPGSEILRDFREPRDKFLRSTFSFWPFKLPLIPLSLPPLTRTTAWIAIIKCPLHSAA